MDSGLHFISDCLGRDRRCLPQSYDKTENSRQYVEPCRSAIP